MPVIDLFCPHAVQPEDRHSEPADRPPYMICACLTMPRYHLNPNLRKRIQEPPHHFLSSSSNPPHPLISAPAESLHSLLLFLTHPLLFPHPPPLHFREFYGLRKAGEEETERSQERLLDGRTSDTQIVSGVLQCVGVLEILHTVLQVGVRTVYVILDLTGRLQVDDITTTHLLHRDRGSRTTWARCEQCPGTSYKLPLHLRPGCMDSHPSPLTCADATEFPRHRIGCEFAVWVLKQSWCQRGYGRMMKWRQGAWSRSQPWTVYHRAETQNYSKGKLELPSVWSVGGSQSTRSEPTQKDPGRSTERIKRKREGKLPGKKDGGREHRELESAGQQKLVLTFPCSWFSVDLFGLKTKQVDDDWPSTVLPLLFSSCPTSDPISSISLHRKSNVDI
ncbi:unnamed protein product [Pleuronectes platessa]|uniref:Uncharacterized protein n=1 Tax=Pleuronectes platessa TaxID=8262 RepID=A0A9N7UQS4_PLEPL|nr:unnamed protein product [Pleuronectes platessa]